MSFITPECRSRPVLPCRTPIVLHDPMMHLLIIVWQTLVFRYQPPSVFCLTHDAGTDIYTGERTTVIDGTISGRATVVGVESVVLLEGTSRGVAEMKEGSGAANPVSFCYDEKKTNDNQLIAPNSRLVIVRRTLLTPRTRRTGRNRPSEKLLWNRFPSPSFPIDDPLQFSLVAPHQHSVYGLQVV
jgi:hypothetical protein